VTLLATIRAEGTFVRLTMRNSKYQLEEVVVKDRHIQERKQSESLNIEVVSQDFIQRNLGGSLMTTLSRLPGIKTIGIGSGQSKPLIRGLGFNRVVVVDKGVKHEGQQWGADHGLEIDQFAAGEIELIKGAASFLYGSDAIGGVINIKPQAPPEPYTLGGFVDLIGKTNNDLYGTSVNLFGRNQRWFFNSHLTHQNYGDYRVPADQVQVYNYPVTLYKKHLRNTAGNETGLHLNTGFIGNRFRSIFYFSNLYSKSGFFANAHGLEPRNVPADIYDASSRDVLKPSQQVNHLKLINRSSYVTCNHQLEMELGYQRNYRQEFSQYVNHGYMPPIYPDTMRIPADLERQFDKQVYSVNLRDEISLGKHNLTIGFNGEHQDNTIYGWSFLVPGFKQTTAGGFAYDKFRVNDKVLLHGAVRYDYGQIRMFKFTDWFESKIIKGNDTILQKLVRANDLNRSFHSLVWSAGLNYNAERFALKANFGKSFRMPIAKELGANGVNYHYFSYERGDAALLPEQSYQADLSLGWKSERWSVQVSPFFNYFPNYIYLNPTPDHDYFYGAGNQVFQYAQSRVMRYGGELQLKYQLLKNLSSELLAEYLYAEQLSGDKKGFTLPFLPPPSALLNLTWSPDLGKTLSNTYMSVDYRITAAQNNIVPPEKKSPGYSIINLQAGTRIRLYQQPIMLSLQVQNLLNTRYLNHTSFYRLIELPEMGRNIILSLKVPFNIHKTHPEQANH
jgi:iron complex outermembrane receptor protein